MSKKIIQQYNILLNNSDGISLKKKTEEIVLKNTND